MIGISSVYIGLADKQVLVEMPTRQKKKVIF